MRWLDEILNNTFTNNAFEPFEIAAYKSLLALCPAAGMDSARPPLEASSKEEERMAQWIDANVRWSMWSTSNVRPPDLTGKAGASPLVSGAGDTMVRRIALGQLPFRHLVNFAAGRNALWRSAFVLMRHNSWLRRETQ